MKKHVITYFLAALLAAAVGISSVCAADRWPSPEDITPYLFTDGELQQARSVVDEHLAQRAEEAGTLSFDVEKVAYDPLLTDHHVTTFYSAGADGTGWELSECYAHFICFSVTYSATYDHEKSPRTDREHDTFGITLYREKVEDPWVFQDSGTPVAELSPQALSQEDLAALPGLDGVAYAGYALPDDVCAVYLQDGTTVRLVQVNLPEDAEDTTPPQAPEATEPAPTAQNPQPEAEKTPWGTIALVVVGVGVVAGVAWIFLRKKK